MKPLTSFITSVVLLASALVGYAGFRSIVADKSVAVASLSGQIQERSDATSRIAAARATLAELAGDETTVRHYFVPQASVVSFINDLQARGSALGAAVDIVSVASVGAPQRPALKLTISARGAFDAVLRTLGSVEYAPYDLSIATLSLNRDAKGVWIASADLSVGSTPPSVASTTPS